MSSLKRVLIMAGGTGGHVFPGLAIANYLREKGVTVYWLGTQKGLEVKWVTEANIPLYFISIEGIRGKRWLTLLKAPLKIMTAVRDSLKLIKQINPDVVVGMGGFVSGPGGVASWLAGKPLVIHEQNAKAGTTNKLLGYFSKRILQGFPDAFKPQSKLIHLGNPIRNEIEVLSPPQESHHHTKKRLLVLGGSLGAQPINEILPLALAQLTSEERPEVWHQTGEKNFEQTKKLYGDLGLLSINTTAFITDMAYAYRWANMVLCRAGGLTVAELCAAGLGAILIPYPYAVDDHQTANANFLVRKKAALCIQQVELTANRLAQVLKKFSQSPEEGFAMAQAAYHLRKVNVAKQFYDVLCEVVSETK